MANGKFYVFWLNYQETPILRVDLWSQRGADKKKYSETKVNASVASTRVQKAFSMNFREQKRLNVLVLLKSETDWLNIR